MTLAHITEQGKSDIMTVFAEGHVEVVRIASDGRIFWKQREVETDEDFRSAMCELRNLLKRCSYG